MSYQTLVGINESLVASNDSLITSNRILLGTNDKLLSQCKRNLRIAAVSLTGWLVTLTFLVLSIYS